jgi:argininosuccinate lyase
MNNNCYVCPTCKGQGLLSYKKQKKLKYIGINAANDPMLLATDWAEYLVWIYRIPFRETHRIIGGLVALSEKLGKDINQLTFKECKGVYPLFGTLMDEKDYKKMIDEVFDLELSMAKRSDTTEWPCPEKFKKQLKKWKNHQPAK